MRVRTSTTTTTSIITTMTRGSRALGALALIALALVAVPNDAGGEPCPPGFRPKRDNPNLCISRKHPESIEELTRLNGGRAIVATAPFDSVAPGAHSSALAQRALVSAASDIPGSDGSWEPYGRGPLVSDDPRFGEVNGLGFGKLAGRIDALAHDPATGRVFAALGTGGVWLTDDLGQSWRSLGESLPTQVVASVAWSSADGGVLLATSGEPTFASNAHTGVGGFRSTDLGATWSKAAGLPEGVLSFDLAVDPTDPGIVYAATGAGLYRSEDAGRSYFNVGLPTGACASQPAMGACLFANVVTDVVVQSPDRFGNAGGAVLAAVGWRGGNLKNADGTVQSPANGLYFSDSGRPGTFQRTPATGFTPQERIGRIEFGPAIGVAQNHDYVYAIVQDAVHFNDGAPVIDAPDAQREITGGLPNATVLEGIYVSADFGRTWTQMSEDNAIANNPASGSALIGFNGLYMPGIQAWYNEWIAPDPTRQDANGVPTRLTFGLEEVWQNEITAQPQNGRSTFKVIGRYYGGRACLFLDAGLPACPTNRAPTVSTTTHPDQHAGLYIPRVDGGVTLAVGNDGGFYKQSVGPGEEFDNGKWGDGANEGFNTLLPYAAAMAKDGTVWMGLQDNGTAKVQPDRRQFGTYGGDGFFVAVDPDKSDVAYGETPGGSMRVTTDGGRSWRDIPPRLSSPMFSTPFVMDPTDANHLMVAGGEVMETVSGPRTGQQGAGNWERVFSVGQRVSAIDLVGDSAYVGFCGACDLLNAKVPFSRGLATNVGGRVPGKRMTGNGWHLAKATGLPRRYISAIAIDPDDPRTVYLTLGGYSRRWVPPGSFSDANREIGSGHVFKSTDAGETFRDISGNLPDTPATWIELRGNQLVVGTDIGVFLSRDSEGSEYAALANGLPLVPISTVQIAPQDTNLLLAATYGRGLYTYRFDGRPGGSQVAAAPGGVTPATGRGIPAPVSGIALFAAVVLTSMARRHLGGASQPA